MVKEILKSAFFGYSKSDVCEYIARMNEEFSQRLTAKDNENTSREAELRAQIASLQEENRKLKEKQDEIASALVDAKSFASELKAKAEAENQTQRSKITARNVAEYRRIQSVATSVDSVRSVFRSIIEKMDFEMKEYMEHCNKLEINFEEGESESAYLSQEL